AALFERRTPRSLGQRDRPEAFRPLERARRGVECEPMRGRQLVAAPIERLRRGHVAVAQEVVERGAVDLELLGRAGDLERLELGCEREAAAVVVVIERLD